MDEAKYRDAEAHLWGTLHVEPTERMVPLAVTGTRVRVQEVGSGPPVIFIHGGPNSGTTWAEMVTQMPDFRCLMVDRPGTGLSERADLSLENFVRFCERFVGDLLDGLGLDRAHVVASSLGGCIALRSASTAPERLDRMVQMACPAFVRGMATPMFMRLMGLGPVRALLNVIKPSDRSNRSIMRQIGHGASLDKGLISQDFMDWYLALGRYTDTMRNEGELIGKASGLRGFDTSMTMPDDVFRAVTTPTYFWWGADDAFGSEEVARHVVDLMPRAELQMVPESGHLPWLDNPTRAAEIARAFLRSAADR
jgi:pimeloyl-ACP methyl ester carboxylesterase